MIKFNNLILHSLLVIIACSNVNTLLGQEKTKDSLDFIKIKEVNVLGFDNQNLEELKHAFVGLETLQNSSPVDLSNSLNQVSGVYVLSGALNTNRITVRGIGARTPYATNKLRMYYNDIPITNGIGETTIEAFDVENINSISVVKGPKGYSYGSNLGGAISIKTKRSLKEMTKATNSFSFGSYNMIKNSLNVQHTKKRLSFNINYSHLDTDGYRQNNKFNRDGVLLDFNYRLNRSNEIGLLINYTDYFAQIPSSISKTAFNENPKQAAKNWLDAKGYEQNKQLLTAITYKHLFNKNLENKSILFYSNLNHYEPRPFNILQDNTNAIGFRTNFNGKIKRLKNLIKYSFGTEFYNDRFDWTTYKNDYKENGNNGSLQGELLNKSEEIRWQINTFSSFLIAVNNFKAQIALNANKTEYELTSNLEAENNKDTVLKSFKIIVLPSLNLEYKFNDAISINSNISKGFSNPSLEETLTPTGSMNQGINQETGWSYELGTNTKLLQDKFGIALSVYRMDIKNLLVAQRIDEDIYVGKNAGKTQHNGIEMQMDYTIDNRKKTFVIKPYFNYAYSNHKFIDFIDRGRDFSGNDLTGVPKNKINSGVLCALKNGIYWNIAYQYIDKIPLLDSNALYSDSFSLFNSKIGYDKSFKEKITIGLGFGVDNVLNTVYSQSVLINAVGFGGREPRYYYPGNARNFYANIKFNYKI